MRAHIMLLLVLLGSLMVCTTRACLIRNPTLIDKRRETEQLKILLGNNDDDSNLVTKQRLTELNRSIKKRINGN